MKITSIIEKHSPKIVALDGNIPSDVLTDAVSLCTKLNIPGENILVFDAYLGY